MSLLMAARLHPLTWRIWLLLFVSTHSPNRGQSDRRRGATTSFQPAIKTLYKRRKNTAMVSLESRDVELSFAVVTFCSYGFVWRENTVGKSWSELRLSVTTEPRCSALSYANTVSHYSRKAQISEVIFSPFSLLYYSELNIWLYPSWSALSFSYVFINF